MVNKRKADSTMERAAKKQSSASVPATGNTYPSPEVVPLSKKSFTGCVDKTRIRVLREGNIARQGPVVYWMSRDQRVHDNWAVLYGCEVAKHLDREFHIVFDLVDCFRGAGFRQYAFMLRGMREMPAKLSEFGMGFSLLQGNPEVCVEKFTEENEACLLICDFSPLNTGRKWRDSIAEKVTCPVHEVDAHNVVPVWEATDKQEWAAATIRPKLQAKFAKYFNNFPKLEALEKRATKPKLGEKMWYGEDIDFEAVLNSLDLDKSVEEVNWLQPGEEAAKAAMKSFIHSSRIRNYGEKRNLPELNQLSHMSPYLHFGHIAPQRLAVEAVRVRSKAAESVDAFVEELVIRRELSDNFCFYNPYHDSYKAIPPWAQKTLDDHRSDKRQRVYSREQLEAGKTHDDLWNAAQLEMVKLGKMHGYMRMYWAKKILEWSKSPEEALETAIYLNDKYELDGRDPNGYVGCLWSIGGVHDRAWTERPIFGKIRYMNYDGCKRKFDIVRYMQRVKATPMGGKKPAETSAS